MLTNIKNKALTIAFAIVMLISAIIGFGAMKGSAKAEESETPILTIKTNNVSYDDSVYILYAVKCEGFDSGKYQVKMLFWTDLHGEYTKNSEAYAVTDQGSSDIDGENCLIFYSQGIAAKKMTDDIYARAYVDINGTEYYSDVTKFSVLEYVCAMRDKDNDDDLSNDLTDNQREMFDSMLAYGGAAQKLFNYKTYRLANDTYYSIDVCGGKIHDGFDHGRYKKDDALTLIADKPAEGKRFSHWEDKNGNNIGTNEEIEIVVGDSDERYEAIYKDNEDLGTEGVTYKIVDDHAEVTGYEGSSTEVVIAKTYQGLPVTSIGEKAFYNCSSLTEITIPDSVMSMGNRSFESCSSLTKVNYTGTIDQWVQIDFEYGSSNPLFYVKNLYINNELITEANITTATKINDYVFCHASLTRATIGDSVTNIGLSAFSNCTSLESITIGTGVTNIGVFAFSNCSSLTEITIPNSVINIRSGAFSSCTSLTGVAIPDSVTRIESQVFLKCPSLTSISVDENNKNYKSIDGNLYSKDGKTLVQYAIGKKDTLFTIPDGVTSIGDHAFYSCESLINVIIPDGVISIGYGVFAWCDSLTSIIIPDGVTFIYSRTFEYCSSLENVKIGSGVTAVSVYAFRDCSKLTTVYYGGNEEEWTTLKGNSAADGNTCLTGATIYYYSETRPTTEGNYWHYDADKNIVIWSLESTGLAYSVISETDKTCKITGIGTCTDTDIIIPSSIDGYSVTEIGGNGFRSNTSITSVVIPDGVTSIGYDVFYGCSSLTKVNYTGTIDQWVQIDFATWSNPTKYAKDLYINDELVTEANITTATKINAYAFIYCSSLTSVTIGDSVTNIGASAFSDCSSLKKVNYTGTIDQWVQINFVYANYMSSNPLKYAKSLYINDELVTEANITTATKINAYAFDNYWLLTSVTIGNSVKSIGDWAFLGCSSLTSITIPDSVTSIGDGAFWMCRSLTSITIPDSVTDIGDDAFTNCNSLTSITVDENNQNYKSIDGNLYSKDGKTLIQYTICKADASFTIPDSVTSIGYRAFYSCDSLVSITIPDSVTSIGDYAFGGTSLLRITIPDSVTSIGDCAFEACVGLTSITIGKGVTSIGNCVFQVCESLTSVVFEDTDGWYVTSSSSDWENKTGGTLIDVTDSSTNATYFRDTYESYYWYKA